MFNYIKNQYMVGNFTDDNLVTLVQRKWLTEEQRNELLTMKGEK